MYSSAKKLHRVLSSTEIRKTFIDYFTVKHDHKFVRSSPVVPFCDPTVAFVNAGMNQFKSVFLGQTQPIYRRVANSQKCVRVGGKHNDLSIVGQDGYHHTFFEMLGNWSFGDYFKREACEMSLELLRGPYNINPQRLYVTYFAGDKDLQLPADLECFEVWRSLGFPADRILPFGVNDNFWEMGATGPCGPCTEIHIDHCPEMTNINDRAKLVNTGRHDLTELWNLVFIQYKRNEDGSITQLPTHHVDTGMGFERLTAILQNKSSNYDTDLFSPLFDEIQKISKVPHYNGSFPTNSNNAVLDTGYRVLADHARMVTVCLADGMLPDQNQKLRRVLRKAFSISENVFANEGLLLQLVPVILKSLGPTYPEMFDKQTAIHELISHEQDIYKSLRQSSSKAFAEIQAEFPYLEDNDLMECPGFVPAFREFVGQKESFKNHTIPGSFLFKLTDTYGLTEENFQKLATLEKMTCDLEGYREHIANAKLRTKSAFSDGTEMLYKRTQEALASVTKSLPATNNKFKYVYVYKPETKEYDIPTVNGKILGILCNGLNIEQIDGVDLIPNKDTICIITDASNFYYESGGQQSDRGTILVETGAAIRHELQVIDVKNVNDCIVHVCKVSQTCEGFRLKNGDNVELVVDAAHRKAITCHHTATHLLNGAIRSLFKKVTYQVSSAVTDKYCKLEVGLIGKRLTRKDVEDIDDLIGYAICSATPVNTQITDSSELLQQNDVTIVPGEIYPETGLRLVSINCDNINMLSKELCCGTHVTNTQEIEYFCITNLKLTNRARYAFSAVAGPVAESVLTTGALLKHRVDMLEKQFKTDKLTNATEVELQKIRNNILHTKIVLPFALKVETLERINKILRKLKESTRTTLKEFVEVEMRNVLFEKPVDMHPFILHYISSSALMEEIPLQKATNVCTDRPILVIGMCNSIVKARCCVPAKYISDDFNAEKWLRMFSNVFNGQLQPQKGHNLSEVCNMKGKKVSTQFEEQLEVAMADAHTFASSYML